MFSTLSGCSKNVLLALIDIENACPKRCIQAKCEDSFDVQAGRHEYDHAIQQLINAGYISESEIRAYEIQLRMDMKTTDRFLEYIIDNMPESRQSTIE